MSLVPQRFDTQGLVPGYTEYWGEVWLYYVKMGEE